MSPTGSVVRVRRFGDGDAAWVLDRNAANLPAVGPMDAARLEWFVEHAPVLLVAEVDELPAGFLIGLEQGSPYASPNYRWFAERYPSFVYVDRVVVDEPFRAAGVGRRLYDYLVGWSDGRHPVLCAEVNTVPPNEVSLRFHERYGFAPVGSLAPYEGIEVALLARPLVPPG
jgi:uncharacterized protein